MSIVYNTSIIRDGLVLHYDANNKKSYSQNVHPSPRDIYAWANEGGKIRCTIERDYSLTSPAKGIPMKMVATSTDPYVNTYNTGSWSLAHAHQGETWTASIYAKAAAPTTCELFIFEINSGGTTNTLGTQTFNVTTEWQRFEVSRLISDPTTEFVQMRIDGPQDGSTTPVWFDGVQLERASSATAFNPITNPWGLDIFDLSKENQHGFLNGGEDQRPAFVEGTPNYFDFSETTDDRFRAPTTVPLSSKVITVSAWLKVETHQNFHNFVQHNWVNNGWLLYGRADGFLFGLGGNDGATQYNAASFFNSTDWTHVTGRYDGATVQTLINGVPTGNSVSIANTTLDTGSLIYIGDSFVTGKSLISDVLIYDRALSDAEVKQNFETTRGRFGV
jgi:hypothetical protein